MQTQEEKLEIINNCIEKAEMCYVDGLPVVPLKLLDDEVYCVERGIHKLYEVSSFTFDYFEDQYDR